MSLAVSQALEPESKNSGKPVLLYGRQPGWRTGEILCPAVSKEPAVQGLGVWWRVEQQEGQAPQTRLPDLPGLQGSGGARMVALCQMMKQRC